MLGGKPPPDEGDSGEEDDKSGLTIKYSVHEGGSLKNPSLLQVIGNLAISSEYLIPLNPEPNSLKIMLE
jgi:hypothetical protein